MPCVAFLQCLGLNSPLMQVLRIAARIFAEQEFIQTKITDSYLDIMIKS